jgi:hypothetical protein
VDESAHHALVHAGEKGDCAEDGGGEEGQRKTERALGLRLRNSPQYIEVDPERRRFGRSENGVGPIGLRVLSAGGCRGENLTPLECLVEAFELRKKVFTVAVVLGACVLRLRVCARAGSGGGAAAAAAGRLRGLCCCLQIGVVVLLKEVLVQAL